MNTAVCVIGRLACVERRHVVFILFVMLIILLCLFAPRAWSIEMVQRGVVIFDENPAIQLSEVRSGALCDDVGGSDEVCNTEATFTVLGRSTCIGTDGASYPCTRYGYRFDYAGAQPGTRIECTATQKNPFPRGQKQYTLDVDAASGTIRLPSWVQWVPVQQRAMVTEVHECTYLGQPLATIEYIMSWEPDQQISPLPEGEPVARGDQPYLPGVPKACEYLTEDLASVWTGGTVQAMVAANEHFPILRSHCGYDSIIDPRQRARIEFRFRPSNMFDMDKLSPLELKMAAAFSASGTEPTEMHTQLGKLAFVYNIPPNRSVLMVFPGIQGPPMANGGQMELGASFDIQDTTRGHQERLACLNYLAKQSLAFWKSKVRKSDNYVVLDTDPEIDNSCLDPALQ